MDNSVIHSSNLRIVKSEGSSKKQVGTTWSMYLYYPETPPAGTTHFI